MNYAILLVEDEKEVSEYIADVLVDNGYVVRTAHDGTETLKELQKLQPDLMILDLGLPTVRGETVCIETKKMYPELPIIILTAQNTTPDIIKGLNLGADDYVSKPFEIEELLARINARLRSQNYPQNQLQVADLVLDTEKITVERGKKKIFLTPQEFKLLEYLMMHKEKVLTRTMILNRLWLYSPDIDTRVVDVYIGYLRKKVDAEFTKKLIHSIRGFGYVIKE
ncbi:hypothetical protein A2690_02975 [Candidatus Roizmanbacteria bacterium RIFCSPHIGHO2_01_FULL_39_12b]|uniref:DNA-binding response regulator n=1 Tax=Candidatus Roizmanbacteria bacterium RIFCSPHIGHO2_01_FULL_39_12b TaxID=1802030 RepID=A0A1F7G807_9BACT|nr:MAG: hypothetical protein A2690_02975 [Candidatus Roizmanbacteria bacterium RIFCSPHIGHO2_01_FULL_39_12b]OGK45942.1 MAG: hypothetical protein A3B46_02780 [Candidatus Roizmanbacteria bacterium RIFCSPLOWO2_01_FULL_39_19]